MSKEIAGRILTYRHSPHEIPLSNELTDQWQSEVEAGRETTIPDLFEIPEWRLATDLEDTNVVDVTAGRRVSYEETEYTYTPFQVSVLNMLLASEGPISLNAIAEQMRLRKNQQLEAVGAVCSKTGLTEDSAFMKQIDLHDKPHYFIDQNIAFVDRRRDQKISERELAIRAICRTYNNDPAVLSKLNMFYANTIEHLPSEWSAGKIGQQQMRGMSRLSASDQNELAEELYEIADRYPGAIASEDELRQAAVAYNKLVYSFTKLAHYMVLESAGYVPKVDWNPLAGYMRSSAEHDLSWPLYDALQSAAFGVIKAIHTYESARGGLATHIITTVNHVVRRETTEFNSHYLGLSRHEAEATSSVVSARRMFLSDEVDYEDIIDKNAYTDSEQAYESILTSSNAEALVRAVMRADNLRTSERLVLSLSTGIYMEEFEGRQLRGTAGKLFTYDEHLLTNPIFRDGMTDKNLGIMFGLEPHKVSKLRREMFTKLEGTLRTILSNSYYQEKYSDSLWAWIG